MTGLDTAGPRVGKTIREKTSLLPGSCALLGHLPALGVSPTCQPPATGNGSLAGEHAPDHAADASSPVVIDVDATLVTAHSEKEAAAPTFKRGFGHHPLWAFLDHGAAGTGEPLAFLLRAGNAGSNK